MSKKQSLGHAAVSYGKNFLGVPYVWGGNSPGGFDCSGFVNYTYRKLGVSLPRTSAAQWDYLKRRGKGISINQLQPGDLVFFGKGKVSDVKMYAGNGMLIGASGGKKLKGSVKMLPLGYRKDYQGFAAVSRNVNGVYPMSFDAPEAQGITPTQDVNAKGTDEVYQQYLKRKMILGSIKQPSSTTWQRTPVLGEQELKQPDFLELEPDFLKEGVLT